MKNTLKILIVVLLTTLALGCCQHQRQDSNSDSKEVVNVVINDVDELEMGYFKTSEGDVLVLNRWDIAAFCRHVFPSLEVAFMPRVRYVFVDGDWFHSQFMPYNLARYQDIEHGPQFDSLLAANLVVSDLYRVHSKTDVGYPGLLVGIVQYKAGPRVHNSLNVVVFVKEVQQEAEETAEVDDANEESGDTDEIGADALKEWQEFVEIMGHQYRGAYLNSNNEYIIGYYFVDPATGNIVEPTEDLLQRIWFIHF